MTFLTVFKSLFKVFFGLIWKLLKIRATWYLTFLLIILLQAGITSYEQRSISPFFSKVAQEFILSTDNLNEQSLEVIEKGGIWDTSLRLPSRIWDFIKNIWYYSKSLIIIYIFAEILILTSSYNS